MDHLLELLARDALLSGSGFSSMNLRLLHHVAGAEKQQAFARQTIAPGAPGFLVVAFDVLRQIVMDDEAHVRFVDAHAERDRRANHAHFVAQKKFLVRARDPLTSRPA